MRGAYSSTTLSTYGIIVGARPLRGSVYYNDANVAFLGDNPKKIDSANGECQCSTLCWSAEGGIHDAAHL